MASNKFRAIHNTALSKIILKAGYEKFDPDSMSIDEFNKECSDLLQQNIEEFEGITEVVFRNHVKKFIRKY